MHQCSSNIRDRVNRGRQGREAIRLLLGFPLSPMLLLTGGPTGTVRYSTAEYSNRPPSGRQPLMGEKPNEKLLKAIKGLSILQKGLQ